MLLYVTATFFYPGGNQADENFKGFSWAQNYWCNLLNENAINGHRNPARPIAITAMAILGASLAFFWYIFPLVAGINKPGKIAIQVSGFIAIILLIFLSTVKHDIVINTATLFGLIAIAGTLIGLRKLKWRKLFWFGLSNILLIGVNNVFYYDKKLIMYLPIVQKITFLLFLIWFCLVQVNLYRKERIKR